MLHLQHGGTGTTPTPAKLEEKTKQKQMSHCSETTSARVVFVLVAVYSYTIVWFRRAFTK